MLAAHEIKTGDSVLKYKRHWMVNNALLGEVVLLACTSQADKPMAELGAPGEAEKHAGQLAIHTSEPEASGIQPVYFGAMTDRQRSVETAHFAFSLLSHA